jgi:hypothetical protein
MLRGREGPLPKFGCLLTVSAPNGPLETTARHHPRARHGRLQHISHRRVQENHACQQEDGDAADGGRPRWGGDAANGGRPRWGGDAANGGRPRWGGDAARRPAARWPATRRAADGEVTGRLDSRRRGCSLTPQWSLECASGSALALPDVKNLASRAFRAKFFRLLTNCMSVSSDLPEVKLQTFRARVMIAKPLLSHRCNLFTCRK